MSNRLRLLIGFCMISVAFFWDNLENIIPTIPDEGNKITIEKPDTEDMENWDSVSDSITDPIDKLKLCVFNKVFADRVTSYEATAQQINDIYVEAAKNVFGDTIKGKYEQLSPAAQEAMKSVLGTEDHKATQKEKDDLSKKFMSFAWYLNN
jgi:hypothetical protein